MSHTEHTPSTPTVRYEVHGPDGYISTHTDQRRARRKVDRLDNAYGAYVHSVRKATVCPSCGRYSSPLWFAVPQRTCGCAL